jgi:hypothetical protein
MADCSVPQMGRFCNNGETDERYLTVPHLEPESSTRRTIAMKCVKEKLERARQAIRKAQGQVQLWNLDPGPLYHPLHSLVPCPHLLELQRQSPVTPKRPGSRRAGTRRQTANDPVPTLLDICARAILLHQHLVERRREDLALSANRLELNLELLPRELRSYLKEHYLCNICRRPSRGCNGHGWCPSCVQSTVH